MNRARTSWAVLVLASVASLSACAGSAGTPAASSAATASAATVALPPASAGPQSAATVPAPAESALAPAAAQATPDAALPLMVVHKSPTCGCCGAWIEHMQKAGFKVEVRNSDDLNPLKEQLGVPYGKGSCHTAEVGGYFVEGHVPAGDIKRLLADKPDAKGLAAPGMPLGSPGMEVPDGSVQPYVVELVARDGTTSAFAHHGR